MLVFVSDLGAWRVVGGRDKGRPRVVVVVVVDGGRCVCGLACVVGGCGADQSP